MSDGTEVTGAIEEAAVVAVLVEIPAEAVVALGAEVDLDRPEVLAVACPAAAALPEVALAADLDLPASVGAVDLVAEVVSAHRVDLVVAAKAVAVGSDQ